MYIAFFDALYTIKIVFVSLCCLSLFMMYLTFSLYSKRKISLISKKNFIQKKYSVTNLSLDLIKFLAACGIFFFHVNPSYFPSGFLFVILFFIMSGFLFYQNKNRYRDQPFLKIILKRVGSYYFYYLISLVLWYYVAFWEPVYIPFQLTFRNILNYLLFLPMINLSPVFGSQVLWFLGVYTFLFLILLIAIKIKLPLTPIFVFVSLPIVLFLSIFSPRGSPLTTHISFSFLNHFSISLGFLYGIAGIGLGWIWAALLSKLSLNISAWHQKIGLGVGLFLLFCEGNNILPFPDASIYIVSLFLLFYASLEENTLSLHSDVASFFSCLGALSVPIYIFHYDLLYYFQPIGLLRFMQQNPIVFLLITLLFSLCMLGLKKKISLFLQKMIKSF